MKHGITCKIASGVTAVALSALLGACSSSSGSNSPASGGANSASGADSASGANSASASSAADVSASFCAGKKTIGYVDIFNSSPIETVMSNVAQEIAWKFGWNFKLVDGAGDFSKMETGLQNFVAQRVNLIIVASSDAAPLRQGLEAAKAAGIPVVEIGGGTTSSTSSPRSMRKTRRKWGRL